MRTCPLYVSNRVGILSQVIIMLYCHTPLTLFITFPINIYRSQYRQLRPFIISMIELYHHSYFYWTDFTMEYIVFDTILAYSFRIFWNHFSRVKRAFTLSEVHHEIHVIVSRLLFCVLHMPHGVLVLHGSV